jgi:hypothetical protein
MMQLTIKVPAGLNFLGFPDILKLREGEKMREEGEGEGEMEDVEGESSDSKLFECGKPD